MRLAMHQSQYLPWPPYFRKVARADAFVLMDRVQFQKNGLHNRNRIRDRNGAFWLTVPVCRDGDGTIAGKRLADPKWARRHWHSLQSAYGRSPWWARYADALASCYGRPAQTLGEVNERLLRWLFHVLEIDTPVHLLSALPVSGRRCELLVACCRTLGADVYVSGPGARAYLEAGAFERAGIAIEWLPSIPPVYPQAGRGFESGLSMIDLLMQAGESAARDYVHARGEYA